MIMLVIMDPGVFCVTMFIRPPASPPLVNSSTRLAILLRSGTGSRMVEIGDRTVIALILLSALLLAWYLVATLYLVMRDDVVISLINGERRRDYAYEERIAELRSRIDRLTTRQVINQDTIDDRVAGLVARQAELEARQLMVADIGARAASAGIAVETRENSAMGAPLAFTAPNAGALPGLPSPSAKPRPLPLEPPAAAGTGGFDALRMRGAIRGVVDEVEKRTETMERSQIRALETITNAAVQEASAGQSAVIATGLRPSRFGKYMPGQQDALSPAPGNAGADTASAVGGPLMPPIPGLKSAELFETQISRVERAIQDAGHARTVLRALPLGRPLNDGHTTTSGFGTRQDPFTRALAQHSGMDIRAPSGMPVRATASGRIFEAGTNGGYGLMVEIDHGFGLTTRYAHLSSILVREGDIIRKGDVIGLVGSTGRSTGPHLHYEVRIDDDATDPARFWRGARPVKSAAR